MKREVCVFSCFAVRFWLILFVFIYVTKHSAPCTFHCLVLCHVCQLVSLTLTCVARAWEWRVVRGDTPLISMPVLCVDDAHEVAAVPAGVDEGLCACAHST